MLQNWSEPALMINNQHTHKGFNTLLHRVTMWYAKKQNKQVSIYIPIEKERSKQGDKNYSCILLLSL